MDETTADTSRDDRPTKRRRPWLAGLLALVFPGLGHMYCGRPLLAVAAAATVAFSPYTFWLVAVHWDTKPFNVLGAVAVLLGIPILWIVSAVRIARPDRSSYVPGPFNRRYIYILTALLFPLVYGFTLLLPGEYQTYHVPTSSFEDAILVGERLIADHLAYDTSDPEMNDVIVFIFHGDGKTLYLERVVGCPGDTVEIKDKVLHINGEIAPAPPTIKYIDTTESGEQHTYPRNREGRPGRDNFGPYVIASDMYFVMGDNRDNSSDSRFWGPVPRENILGKAIRIYWSSDFDRIGMRIE